MKQRPIDVRREARVFLKRYPDATSDEIDTLYEWMQDGHSPYENGDGVYDDTAIRWISLAPCASGTAYTGNGLRNPKASWQNIARTPPRPKSSIRKAG